MIKQTIHYRGGRGETFTEVCPVWFVEHAIEALESEGWVVTAVTQSILSSGECSAVARLAVERPVSGTSEGVK